MFNINENIKIWLAVAAEQNAENDVDNLAVWKILKQIEFLQIFCGLSTEQFSRDRIMKHSARCDGEIKRKHANYGLFLTSDGS